MLAQELMSQFEAMYTLDYQMHWLDKATIYSYVGLGYITADGYKRITGEDYVPETAK